MVITIQQAKKFTREGDKISKGCYRITKMLNFQKPMSLAESTELIRLGITYLRIRGMGIENPIKGF